MALWPAHSVGDDIEIYADESRTRVALTWHNLRQQNERPPGKPNFCLADFVAPKDSGRPDYLGGFAVTAGLGIEKKLAEFEAEKDDYSAIMLKALADRLAEAFAEWLHAKVRRELWAYAPDEALDNAALVREEYRGIRPAPGYPACPDHAVKAPLFALLRADAIGMSLTESFAMLPTAAVSGFYSRIRTRTTSRWAASATTSSPTSRSERTLRRPTPGAGSRPTWGSPSDRHAANGRAGY